MYKSFGPERLYLPSTPWVASAGTSATTLSSTTMFDFDTSTGRPSCVASVVSVLCAERLQAQMLSLHGAARAADIVEDRLKTTSLDHRLVKTMTFQ